MDSALNNSSDSSISNSASQRPFAPLNKVNSKEISNQKENNPSINASSVGEYVSYEEEIESKKSIEEVINPKLLYEKLKKDLDVSENNMLEAIKKIEEWVKMGEKKRNYKMKSEFEREKEYKLEEQSEIKNKIEELTKNNINEKLINHFNLKISQQDNLYNKYDEMKKEVFEKIQFLKKNLPEIEKKVAQSSENLKNLNKENLALMDKINDLDNAGDINNNISTNMNKSQSNNNSSVIFNNSQVMGNQSTEILNSSTKIPGVININEIIEENEDIREQYNRILEMKKLYKNRKIENQQLTKSINEMNMDCFLFKKIFNEGMHEIAKELMKVHELKLDKVISETNNNNISHNTNGNSLYFEIVKGNSNKSSIKDESLKLPIINNNIIKKYNYPVVEKSNPNTLIYKIVKKTVDENHANNKVSNIKKNKIEWEDFKKFSPYQIFTILNMNKDVIKKIESNLFPRKLIFSGPMQNSNNDDSLINNQSEIQENGDLNENDINEYFS